MITRSVWAAGKSHDREGRRLRAGHGDKREAVRIIRNVDYWLSEDNEGRRLAWAENEAGIGRKLRVVSG